MTPEASWILAAQEVLRDGYDIEHSGIRIAIASELLRREKAKYGEHGNWRSPDLVIAELNEEYD